MNLKLAQVISSPNAIVPVPSGKSRSRSRSKRHAKSNHSKVKARKTRRRFKKMSKSERSKKHRQHLKNKRRGLRNRHGKTVAQIILLGLNAYGNKKGCTFKQLCKLLKSVNIKISDFILRTTLKRMVKIKVVKHSSATRYVSSKRNLTKMPKNIRKKATKKTNQIDSKFRQKLRRIAHKQTRRGKTYAEITFKHLAETPKQTHNQIMRYLDNEGMGVSNFILKRILNWMMSKKLVSKTGEHYSLTKSSPCDVKIIVS